MMASPSSAASSSQPVVTTACPLASCQTIQAHTVQARAIDR